MEENTYFTHFLSAFRMCFWVCRRNYVAGTTDNFTEYDRDIHGESGLFELHEDLLQLRYEKENLIIDLGWYPNYDADGNYILMLVKDYKWDCPLEYVSSKSKKEIVACIEKWVCYGFFAKYCSS